MTRWPRWAHTDAMSLPAERQTVASPRWASVRRLALAAFAGQTLASLLLWLLVNDESRQGAWSNTDFGQWLSLSLLCMALARICSVRSAQRAIELKTDLRDGPLLTS